MMKYSSSEESALLTYAVRRGLIRPEQVASSVDAGGLATLQPGQLQLGPILDGLVQAGVLTSAQIAELAAELAEHKTLAPIPETLPGSVEQAAHPAGGPAMTSASAPDAAGYQFPVQNWDRYEFLSLLGRGGMGAVYKARDRTLGRIVALKFIRHDDPQQVSRFLQEARAQARIDHPGVCKVFDLGMVERKPYIAMQFVDGASLDKAAAGLSLPEQVRLVREAAEALHAAHEIGIIHRDIKPANIMVELGADSLLHPIIMDFGLARETTHEKGITESGAVMGTPAYMSPEQARGDVRRLDRRTDVYALGATLYDLLAGVPPFEDESVVNVLLSVMNREPEPIQTRNPAVPQVLSTIVGRCLAKDASERYGTTLALADDLGRFLASQQIRARRVSRWAKLRWWGRQNPTLAATALGLSLTLLALFGYWGRTQLVLLRKEQQAQKLAEISRQLGQEVRDLDWTVRMAHALPLHDTTYERSLVGKRLADLDTRLAGYGQLGAGLGHYVLGRGFLSLHEWARALAQFELAQQGGEDSPDLHYGLGRALVELYLMELAEARRAGDASFVAQRKRELTQRRLQPAQQHLQRCRDRTAESTYYVDALLNLCADQLDAAHAMADRAIQQYPWLYEARILQGDMATTLGNELLNQGKLMQALEALNRAEAAYESGAQIGRSDAQLHEAIARLFMERADLDLRQRRSQAAAYQKSLAASQRSLLAEPRRPSAHAERARTFLFLALAERLAGHDPGEQIRSCIELAEKAIALSPQSYIAYDALGNCWTLRAQLADQHGELAQPDWDRAAAALDKAIAIAPRFPWGQNDLGNVYLGMARSRRGRGEDPLPAYAAAVRSYSAAAAMDPQYQVARENTLFALMDRTDYQSERGLPVTTEVEQAARIYQACGAPCASSVISQVQLATIYATQAQSALAEGKDLQAALAAVRKHLPALVQGDPNFPWICNITALAEYLDARQQLNRSQAQLLDTALERAEAVADRCVQVTPDAPEGPLMQARILLLRAATGRLAASARARPTVASLQDEALRLAQRAVQQAPASREAKEVLAEAYLASLGRTAGAAHRALRQRAASEGLDVVRAGLGRDPRGARLWAQSAALRAVLARELPAAARIAALHQAWEDAERALALNPLLQREFSALWPPPPPG